jgi:apolipoprotein N-acyltransferase
MWYLGWFALVPLLMAVELFPGCSFRRLTLIFGVVFSAMVHRWYLSIFGTWPGLGMLIGAGAWYSLLLWLGIVLRQRTPWLGVFVLPVVWTALEFVKFIAPYVEDWWFVLLAKSQWSFPPALQILSVTGFMGLSFVLMLSNTVISRLVVGWIRRERVDRSAILGLGIAAAVLGWGVSVIPDVPTGPTFSVISTVDMSESMLEKARQGKRGITRNLLETNMRLSTQTPEQTPAAFILWPENKMDANDTPEVLARIGAFARRSGSYVAANVIRRDAAGHRYNTIRLIDPHGHAVGHTDKTHLFATEKRAGFVPRSEPQHVWETPHGKVGLGICYDYHFPDTVQGLAEQGAQVALMPTNDDFDGDKWFPHYHATDAVFRAVEHRMAFATAAVNGVAVLVDPYGRIVAHSGTNREETITGSLFTVAERTPYTRWGNWFGWLMVAVLIGLLMRIRKIFL